MSKWEISKTTICEESKVIDIQFRKPFGLVGMIRYSYVDLTVGKDNKITLNNITSIDLDEIQSVKELALERVKLFKEILEEK